MHRSNYFELRNAIVANLALVEERGYHTNYFAAIAKNLVGNNAHKTNLSTTVDERTLIFGQQAAQFFGGNGKNFIASDRGAAKNTD
jgi:hypothetical protein